MQIKRIEIVGFKSFVDRVALDFSEGISAVVGPNGCGKSNIVDAIRWAMGEQSAKNLRGLAMEDVIFGGSESRKPMGMAEVSMVFSNERGLGPATVRDYPEIMITRRLYRSGESEYLLNKTPCRLLDITELFMDTGIGARAYSIIEQGKIGMILTAKPDDRRFLIEEAAGISKFKSRKKAALRKIEATRQNLLRLRDIIGEVRRQLNALNRQARKAERYRECREEYREIEIRFALQRLQIIQRDFAAEEKAAGEQERQREGQESRVQSQELHLAEERLTQTAAEKDLQQGQERVFHLTGELQKIETRIEFDDKERANLERQKEQLTAESEELHRQLEESAREERELLEGESILAAELERETRRLAEEEAAFGELGGLEESLLAALEKARHELFAIAGELSRLSSRREDIRRRVEILDEMLSRKRQESILLQEKQQDCRLQLAEKEDFLKACRQRRDSLLLELETAREAILLLRRQLESNETLLLERQEALSRSRSRLESLETLERNLEGYADGVRTLLADSVWRERCTGMVADILDVPACHEQAVEMVLGERLQALLVKGPEDALAALDLLRRKGGRGAFLLPSVPVGTPPALSGATPLVDLIFPRSGSEELVAALFQGIFLVEDLKPFIGKVPFGVTLVNPQGEMLCHRGVLHGGAAIGEGEGQLHKRREMKELAAAAESLEKATEDLRRQRQQLKQTFGEAEETLAALGSALHAEELRAADGEKDLLRLQEEAVRLQERNEVLAFEEEQLLEERDRLLRENEQADARGSDLEELRQEQERAVTDLQQELEERRRMTESVRERVTALKVALAGLKEREEGGRRNLQRLQRFRNESRERLQRLEERRQEAETRQRQLAEAGGKARIELEVLFNRREEEKSRIEGLRERFDEKTGQMEVLEEGLRVLRRDLVAVQESLTKRQVRFRELQLELDHLRQTVLDRYRIDLLQLEPDERPFDEETAERRLSELKEQLDDMGEVNLTAIDEYRELEERWQFLNHQEQDLQTSMEGLQTAIAKINRTTRKRFRETFLEVNARFQEVFPRLFQGGKAELTLTDEQDLLETGIEIVVQPPGKKLQNVGLLSGGEKALTAVALIFAIFLIKPSPFCLLDEVDAPLDDANINRFNDMIREMSDRSQFIIVTHNKRTMSIADTLYGVTMEEPGVSKLVSVRMSEI
ncbi:MAG: chromosome segregation protein SMC [Syntrophotaleaceae bacterium]